MDREEMFLDELNLINDDNMRGSDNHAFYFKK